MLIAVSGAPTARAAGDVPVLVVDGEGHGHGVGMAQDGALWMGRAGASKDAIVGHFYPGVGIGKATGPVRVAVLTDPDGDVLVSFPDGGELRSPGQGRQDPGFPIPVPRGGTARVRHGGRYDVELVGVHAASGAGVQLLPLPTTPSTQPPPTAPRPSSTTTTTRPPTTLVPATTTTAPPSPSSARAASSDHSIWAFPAGDGTIGVPDRNARYRGAVEATAGGGPLRLINEVDVEQYLRGMGEVRNPSWPAASLQAQAVVARTYALRAMRAAGELCDTQRCQVYLGQQAEYAAMDQAVRATAGQVLVYGGGFASAVYSANGAGVSATPSEGFGTPDAAYPYLRAVPYETHSPETWQVRIALTDLAGRLAYRGAISDVRPASVGPSGRATSVTISGSAGDKTLPALSFAGALGLRSTKWAVHVEQAAAPPPPPAAELIQTLPDDVPTTPTTATHRAAPASSGGQSRTLPATIAVAALATIGFLSRKPLMRRRSSHKPG